MAYKKSETISGIVTIPIQTKEGTNSTYARFSIQDVKTNTFIQCMAFGDLATMLAENYSATGKKIIATGKYDDENTFMVKTFQRPTEKGVEPIVDINLRITGSPQKLEQIKRQTRLEQEKEDRVLVRWGEILCWHHKSLCIQLNNSWYHKLYYCQELLGDTYVNRKCREFTKSEGGLLKISKENYLKFLEELVNEAEGKTNPERPSDDLTVQEGEIL